MKVLKISVFNHKSSFSWGLRVSLIKKKIKKWTGTLKSNFTIKFDAQNICVLSYQLYSNLNMNFFIKIFMLCGTLNSNLLKTCSQHQDKV